MKSVSLNMLGTIAVDKRIFKIFTLLVLLVTLLTPSRGHAANLLNDINLSDSRENMEIVLTFEKAFTHKLKPVFYEKSIQLEVPGLVYKKRTIPVHNEFLSEIRVYPFKPGIFRMRMMLAEPGKDLSKDFLIVPDENRIFIRFKRLEPLPNVIEAGNLGGLVDKASLNKLEDVRERDIPIIDNKLEVESLITKVLPEDIPEKDDSNNDILSGKYSLFTALAKMGGALSIVLALIAISAFAATKVFNKGDSLFGKERLIRVLATGQVGIKKDVAIVEVAGEILVLGITANNITMLTKLEGDEAINAVRDSSEKGKGNESVIASFKGMLNCEGNKKTKTFSETLKESEGGVVTGEKRAELIAGVAKIIKSKV